MGDRVWVRNVHCANALAAATKIVWFAPRMSSAAKSTAYDTDIVDSLATSGSVTFSADARDEQASSATNSTGSAMVRGAKNAATSPPAVSTAPTYTRAAVGRSFISSAGGAVNAMEILLQTASSRCRRGATGRTSGSS